MTSGASTSPNGDQSPNTLLQRVVSNLTHAGYYAYLNIDEQNRWTVSADAEDGHIDVRLGGQAYILDVWDTSPGLYWEEENERRFHALERRARLAVPAIARGIVDEDQEIWWDEHEHGVGARITTVVALDQADRIATIAGQRLGALNQLLADVERRLVD